VSLRIVQRDHPSGKSTWIPQKKGELSGWKDIVVYSGEYDTSYIVAYHSLDEAIDNLWRFDGSPTKDTVVYE